MNKCHKGYSKSAKFLENRPIARMLWVRIEMNRDIHNEGKTGHFGKLVVKKT